MLLVTDELARRLETAEAIDAAGCAEAQCYVEINCDSAVEAIGGGVAVFCGASSPLTHAVGVGMHGPVTAEDLDRLEFFFKSRGAPVVIDICPHADPTLRELVANRRYAAVEFLNVMVRETPQTADSLSGTGIEIKQATGEDQDTYVRTVIGGFFGREDLSDEEMRLGTTLFHMPSSAAYLASVDGRAAGGGGVSIRNGVACFFGDATLPAFRNRGVHAAIIGARIAHALTSECKLITAGTVPGSSSQRNYQRLGFQIAYTKTTMVLE